MKQKVYKGMLWKVMRRYIKSVVYSSNRSGHMPRGRMVEMKIVAKIAYTAISPSDIEALEKLEASGFQAQIILDSATETLLVVV